MDYRRLAINLFFFFLGILIPLLAFRSALADPCPDFSTMPYDDAMTVLSTATYDVYYGSWTYSPSATCASDFWINASQRKDWSERDTGSCWGYRIVSYSNMSCTPPPPAEPATCSNGVADPDETGIDCGGSCDSVCDLEGCAPGTSFFTGEGCFPDDPPWDIYKDNLGTCAQGTVNVSPDPTVKICVPYQIVPDADGNCRDGYSIAYELGGGQQLCGPSIVKYSSDDAAPIMEEYSLTDENSGFEPGTFNVVETENIEITDNLDGTSTKVTTTTNTDADNNTQTTTKTEIIDNNTQATISAETVTQGEVSPEDNTENYNYDIGTYELPGSEYDVLPEEKDLDSIFDSIQSWNPFADANERWKITTSASSCTLETSINFLGAHTLGFSLCEYDWVFSSIGYVLIFGAYLFGFQIVARGR